MTNGEYEHRTFNIEHSTSNKEKKTEKKRDGTRMQQIERIRKTKDNKRSEEENKA